MTNKQQVEEGEATVPKEDDQTQVDHLPRKLRPGGLRFFAFIVALGLIGLSFFLEDDPQEHKGEPPAIVAQSGVAAAAAAAPEGVIQKRESVAGEQARAFIASLEKQQSGIDEQVILEQANQFSASGKTSDAYLVYFYLGLQGNGPAAMKLATMADPAHFSAENSFLDTPEPFLAYKWYNKASEAGETLAAERLETLKTWLQTVADKDDQRAQRLLLQWR